MDDKILLVGIDPGSGKNNGLAIYSPLSRQYLEIKSYQLHDLFERIGDLLSSASRLVFIVENPNDNSPLFGRQKSFFEVLKSGILFLMGRSKFALVKRYYYERATRKTKLSVNEFIGMLRSTYAADMKSAQNLGKNKGVADCILAFLDSRELNYITIAPSQRDRADKLPKNAILQTLKMPTKMSADNFRRLTGYSERSNEHGRDAATLVWNRSPHWLRINLKKMQSKK